MAVPAVSEPSRPLTTGRSVILQNTQMASLPLGGGEGNEHLYSLFGEVGELGLHRQPKVCK